MNKTRLPLVGLLLLLPVMAAAQDTVVVGNSATGKCRGPSEPAMNWDSVVVDLEVAPTFKKPPNLPRYPKSMYRDGYAGRIMLSFVIDTEGKVMPGTVSVVQSNDPAFSEWGCDAAKRLQYEPVIRAGRPARALVGQPFTFRANVVRRDPL